MLCFDRLHSTEVENDQVVFRLISVDNKKYQFALTKQMAGLVAAALESAAKHLSPEPHGRPVIPRGIQPVIGPDIEPGLSFDLGGNLTIELSLPPQKLQALKIAIEQLEAHTKPAGSSH